MDPNKVHTILSKECLILVSRNISIDYEHTHFACEGKNKSHLSTLSSIIKLAAPARVEIPTPHQITLIISLRASLNTSSLIKSLQYPKISAKGPYFDTWIHKSLRVESFFNSCSYYPHTSDSNSDRHSKMFIVIFLTNGLITSLIIYFEFFT